FERVLVGRMPERSALRQLVGGVLRVVHEHVDIAREVERVVVQRTDSVAAGTTILRCVVRQIGQRMGAIADTKSECLAALVRDLTHQHVEAFEAIRAAIDHSEGPFATQLIWTYREMRRRHRASQQFHGLDALLRKEQSSARIGSITGGEEGQPVRVIPMQMAEQDRAPKRRATEDAGEVAQTGARVENQRRKGLILPDSDARRMAAHVVELRTDRGSRSTRTAYPYVHDQASSRRWPADNA